MIETAGLLFLTAAAFVATNVDSLLLLVGMLAMGRSSWAPLTGYATATLLVVGGCFALARAGDLLPPEVLGWFGLIPLCLGVLGLIDLWRHAEGAGEPPSLPVHFLAAAVLFLSVSGDNFAVFVPLMAESPYRADVVISIAMLALAACWAALARWLARAPGRSLAIRRLAARVVPFLLVAIGLYILLDTPTDRV